MPGIENSPYGIVMFNCVQKCQFQYIPPIENGFSIWCAMTFILQLRTIQKCVYCLCFALLKICVNVHSGLQRNVPKDVSHTTLK